MVKYDVGNLVEELMSNQLAEQIKWAISEIKELEKRGFIPVWKNEDGTDWRPLTYSETVRRILIQDFVDHMQLGVKIQIDNPVAAIDLELYKGYILERYSKKEAFLFSLIENMGYFYFTSEYFGGGRDDIDIFRKYYTKVVDGILSMAYLKDVNYSVFVETEPSPWLKHERIASYIFVELEKLGKKVKFKLKANIKHTDVLGILKGFNEFFEKIGIKDKRLHALGLFDDTSSTFIFGTDKHKEYILSLFRPWYGQVVDREKEGWYVPNVEGIHKESK